jgi:hypothetical protein
MHCKQRKFGCNRAVIKDTLLEGTSAYSAASSNGIITAYLLSYSVSRVLGKKDRNICYLIQTFAYVTKTMVHYIIRKHKERKLEPWHGVKAYEKVEIQLTLRRFRKIAKSIC